MPRRRPISSQSTPKTTSPSDTPDSVVLPAIEKEIEIVVAEPEIIEVVMPARKEKAPRAVATDIGVVETKEAPRPAYRDEGAPSGMILEPNEPIRLEGEDAGIAVIVKRDVYRKFYPRGTKRPSYMLLYKSGSRVLKSTLMQIPN
jgi:hypothetical protein